MAHVKLIWVKPGLMFAQDIKSGIFANEKAVDGHQMVHVKLRFVEAEIAAVLPQNVV